MSYGVTGGDKLEFNADQFIEEGMGWRGQSVKFRVYHNIVYVSNPVDAEYQCMNFFAPVEYFEGKSYGPYNAETAPIFFPNTVGGYMPGKPGNIPKDSSERINAIGMALLKGYVVAAPGARGRSLKDQNGQFTGKAPACIVDLKAAVRYLRYNDKVMPGDAGKIISNGTSAGGALSALLGATGDNMNYEPYLTAIGAASARDDIFAASCYCPITNLDHADAAYEWQFHGLNNYNSWMGKGVLNAEQIEISAQLKALFPAYLNSLRLKKAGGTLLMLDADGEGSFKEYVKSFVIASAQKALSDGEDLSGLDWMTINDGTVTDIDFDAFVAYATRMKPAPAFDALDLRSPENNLFGTATIDNQHFTLFSQEHSADHTLADPATVMLMNPMYYIGTPGTAMARHWRIRHGAVDRDTSLAIPVMLAAKLRNNGADVDFALPWGQDHGGDYDLEELFAWTDQICR